MYDKIVRMISSLGNQIYDRIVINIHVVKIYN